MTVKSHALNLQSS